MKLYKATPDNSLQWDMSNNSNRNRMNSPPKSSIDTPITPLNSSEKRKRIPKTPITPTTEINWESPQATSIKNPRIMEQASTITQWTFTNFLVNGEKSDMPLESLKTMFHDSQIKNGCLFINGIKGITPAARIFPSGSLTCASCSHLSNVQRGNEIIRILKLRYQFNTEYKGDKASTYKGDFFKKDVHLQSRGVRRRNRMLKGNNTSSKKRMKQGHNLRLDTLKDIIYKETGWNTNFNAELQNCLTIALPKYVVPWSEKNHYKFSDNFNARIVTFLLCAKKLNLIPTNEDGGKKIIHDIVKWVAISEQYEYLECGEKEKQGSLRIFNTGTITALGVKNCELLQDVVERIDKMIQDNESKVVH